MSKKYKPACHFSSAKTFTSVQRAEKLKTQVKEFMQIDSDFEGEVKEYFDVLKELNRKKEIEEFSSNELSANPHKQAILKNYADFLEGENQNGKAAKLYEQLLELNPDHAFGVTFRSYVRVLTQLSQFEKIKELYQNA